MWIFSKTFGRFIFLFWSDRSRDLLESHWCMNPSQLRSQTWWRFQNWAAVLLPTFALSQYCTVLYGHASLCLNMSLYFGGATVSFLFFFPSLTCWFWLYFPHLRGNSFFRSFLVFYNHLTCHLWDMFVHRVCISCFIKVSLFPRKTKKPNRELKRWVLVAPTLLSLSKTFQIFFFVTL